MYQQNIIIIIAGQLTISTFKNLSCCLTLISESFMLVIDGDEGRGCGDSTKSSRTPILHKLVIPLNYVRLLVY